jgi:hypothetical protein
MRHHRNLRDILLRQDKRPLPASTVARDAERQCFHTCCAELLLLLLLLFQCGDDLIDQGVYVLGWVAGEPCSGVKGGLEIQRQG